MSDICVSSTHINSRNGIRTGNIIQHQALTGNRRFGLLSLICNNYTAAEGTDTAALGNRTGIDNAGGFRCIMHNLAACIKILAVTGKGYAGKFAMRAGAVQNTHRIEIGNVRTEGAGNPFNSTALFNQGTLGIKVIHILRPVFNRRITQLSIFADKQLNAACMQVSNVIFRRTAAFDKVQVCAFVYNNQRMLELACALCV